MAAQMTSGARGPVTRLAIAASIALIRLYQWTISPLLGANCRFTPTCSEYAVAAIERFGPARGSMLVLKRLARCHPWGGSGYDPLPESPRGDRAAP